MAEARHIAHEKSEWRALTTEKDWCQVDEDVIGFDSFAKLGLRHTFSPNVKAGSPHSPVYRQGDMFKVVQADAGAHLDSNTSQGSGYTKITKSSANVIVNGKPVAAHNDQCLVNCDAAGVGGAKSKLAVKQKDVIDQIVPEAGRAIGEAAVGFLGMVFTGLNALTPGKRGEESRGKIMEIARGTASTAGDAVVVTYAPALAIADFITGSQLSQAVTQPSADRQQARGQAIADSIRQGGEEAYDRNGAAGLAGWMTTNAAMIVGPLIGKAPTAARVIAAEQKAAKALGKPRATYALTISSARKGVYVQTANAARSAKLRALLEKKWGKTKVDEALKAKKADPKLDALLTDDEYLSVRGYTSHLYDDINPALRSGSPSEWADMVQEASSGMDKMGKNGYGYAGALRRDVYFSDAEIDKFFRRPDGTFSDPAFFSTTTVPSGVLPGNTIIHVEGHSGISVGSLSEIPTEAEVLFKPGTQFKVIEIIEGSPGSKTEIFLKEIIQ